MSDVKKIEPTVSTELTDSHEDQYQLNYIVNFYNCPIEKVVVKQTGKPTDPDDPGK